MTKEKIEDYLLYLKHDKGNAPNSCYSVLTGLRFFYKYVTENQIPVTYGIRRATRKLPQVLSRHLQFSQSVGFVWQIYNLGK
jgi:hypothetical protein